MVNTMARKGGGGGSEGRAGVALGRGPLGPGCRVSVSRGRDWGLAVPIGPISKRKRTRGRPIASGRGSHRCPGRRAPHGRDGPRETNLSPKAVDADGTPALWGR